ncbi:glycosyltransferase [bacterium]|nr:glycosyltransferase [bacterium]
MTPPLNVLRVITWLPVGGIENKILAVLPRLDKRRFNVRLVCLRERGPLANALEEAGVPVEVNEMPTRLSPRGLWNLRALMKRHEIQIVHSHMYRSSVPATIAGRLAKAPVILAQVHNVETWETRRQLMQDRFLCRWRSGIIAVSDRVRRDILEHLPMPPEKVHVIYNGVDIESFADESLREASRTALGLGPDDVAIIYHGRLVEQKNPEALIQIAEKVAKPRSGVHVLVVGDGPKRASLERAASTRGLKAKIRFLGRREDIPALLQASDIAVLPSLKEGFSNALVEAMAAGLAVVATDVGGNAEAVQNGQSGWIVPPGDDEAVLDAVARLVDDADVRDRFSVASRRRAEVFSLDHMVESVERLYWDQARQVGLV